MTASWRGIASREWVATVGDLRGEGRLGAGTGSNLDWSLTRIVGPAGFRAPFSLAAQIRCGESSFDVNWFWRSFRSISVRTSERGRSCVSPRHAGNADPPHWRANHTSRTREEWRDSRQRGLALQARSQISRWRESEPVAAHQSS